jgi:hypothetical protein
MDIRLMGLDFSSLPSLIPMAILLIGATMGRVQLDRNRMQM